MVFFCGVLLEHPADRQTHGQLGLALHEGLVLGLLQAAGVTGVGAVVLLLQLLAGEDGVLGVDDDDIVTAVNMGGVVGFQLAAQQVGSQCSGLAHGLAGCVKDVPFAFNGLLGEHGSGHIHVPPYRMKSFDISGACRYNIPQARSIFIPQPRQTVNKYFDSDFQSSEFLSNALKIS